MATKSLKTSNFSSQEFDNLFCYATSIRENTLLWCNREISTKDWIDVAYVPLTKRTIKAMIRKFRVEGTRCRMRKWCDKYSWMGEWRDG